MPSPGWTVWELNHFLLVPPEFRPPKKAKNIWNMPDNCGNWHAAREKKSWKMFLFPCISPYSQSHPYFCWWWRSSSFPLKPHVSSLSIGPHFKHEKSWEFSAYILAVGVDACRILVITIFSIPPTSRYSSILKFVEQLHLSHLDRSNNISRDLLKSNRKNRNETPSWSSCKQ